MFITVLFMALYLIIFQQPLLLAGATPALTAEKVASCENTNRYSSNQIYAKAASTKEMVACPETRPQVCTQDYQPVCAVLQDGSFKTYSNGCNACSDPAVTGYREGACE